MLDAELAILGIIAEASQEGRAGRDVQNIIDERNVRMWTLIGVQSIFYVLEKLESQGLIECINPDETEKNNRTYRITAAGQGILQTALNDLLSSLHDLPTRFDIGLSNLLILNTEQVRHALVNYQANLQQRHQRLTEQAQILQQTQAPFHILSMFEHQLALLEAEIQWIEAWYPRWLEQAPAEEPHEVPIEDVHLEGWRGDEVILPDHPHSVHKLPTRQHIPPPDDSSNVQASNGIEYPPPPIKRKKKGQSSASPDATKVSSPTRPDNFKPPAS